MPSSVFRSVAFRLAASGAFALILTVSVGAQQEPASGPRSGSSAAPTSGQGRSSTPARPSGPPRSAAPAAPEGAQPRGSSGARQERSESKPASATAPRPEAAKADGTRTDAKPSDAKPSTAKPSTAKPAGTKAAAGKATAGAVSAGPGGGQATLLATYDDWGAYATPSGRSRVCYALSQPTERTPKTASRESAYLFVSFRPSENVRNEVALVMGFPTKDGGDAQATIGSATYGLVTKGQNAWIKNPAEEGQVITTMSRSSSVTVKATSGRGSPTSDRYSLKGFGKALEKAREECK